MSNLGKVIVLPSRDEMERRLVKANDEPHLRERFYPILLRNAGQEKVAKGVTLMLSLAIHDYVQGMPPVMANLMYMQADQFIDAMVDDPEVAQEAKDFLQEGLNASRQK